MVPEFSVAALVPPGESLLLEGLRWYTWDVESVCAPEDEYLIVKPMAMAQTHFQNTGSKITQ